MKFHLNTDSKVLAIVHFSLPLVPNTRTKHSDKLRCKLEFSGGKILFSLLCKVGYMKNNIFTGETLKNIFISLLLLTCIVLLGLAFLLWWIPYVGLTNIHPGAPLVDEHLPGARAQACNCGRNGRYLQARSWPLPACARPGPGP